MTNYVNCALCGQDHGSEPCPNPGPAALPWETAGSSTVEDRIVWDICETGGGDMIADLSECGDEARQEANARLIVTAVNHHAELVEALEAVRAYLVGISMSRRTWKQSDQSLFERVDALLSRLNQARSSHEHASP